MGSIICSAWRNVRGRWKPILTLLTYILDTPCSLLWQGAADLIASRIPPGLLERVWGVPWLLWRVLRRSSGSRGFPRGVLGGLWEVPGGPWEGPRRLWGVPGGLWGGPGEAPGAPRGGPGRHRKHRRFSEGVRGGSGGLPGVLLVVWSGPRDRPGRWKC